MDTCTCSGAASWPAPAALPLAALVADGWSMAVVCGEAPCMGRVKGQAVKNGAVLQLLSMPCCALAWVLHRVHLCLVQSSHALA